MKPQKTHSSLRRLSIMSLAVLPLVLFCVQAAYAAAPCCDIIAVNTQTGVVTAKVNATGQTFQFTLKNSAQLRQLRVGQGVYANLSSKTVSLDSRTVAGNIVSTAAAVSPVAGARAPATSAPAGGTAAASGSTPAPCCSITAINSSSGVVTAKVNSTGQVFQFNLNNAAQLHSVQVGQGVYASFKSNQVSFDGQHSSGRIVSSGVAATSTTATPNQAGLTQPSGGVPEPKYARVNGSSGTVGGPTVFGGNETLEEATKKCQASCDVEGQQHNPPMACAANVTQTNAGQYSCACNCNQVGGGTNGSKLGSVTASGGPTVENTLSAPAQATNVPTSSVRKVPSSSTSAPSSTTGHILSISSGTANVQVDGASEQLQFNPRSQDIPYLQPLVPNQKVWIQQGYSSPLGGLGRGPSGPTVLYLPWPQSVERKDDLGHSHYMDTKVVISSNGNINGTTRTWSTEALRGFHGGVMLFLESDRCDSQGDCDVLYRSPQIHRYGVNGESEGGSDRTDLWSESVSQSVLDQTRHIKIVQLESAENEINNFLADLKAVADVAAPIVSAVVGGGGHSGSSGSNSGSGHSGSGTSTSASSQN